MKPRYVIDTNVLIAATAFYDAESYAAEHATPVEPKLREKVLEWLEAFEHSNSNLVIDYDQKIQAEYENSRFLNHQDYGLQLLVLKHSKCQVDHVPVDWDTHGHGVLPAGLRQVVHDRSDRKMVAAAISAQVLLDEPCPIANASDADWLDWEAALTAHGVEVEQILDVWLKKQWLAKKAKKGK